MTSIEPYGLNFVQNHMKLPFIISSCYLGFIYTFSKYMNFRSAFSLKQPLIIWNLGLCLFSFIGALNTIPTLLYLIYNSNELKDTICEKPSNSWGNNPWIGLFIYSKIPELIDTVFIIARKRPLLFLHWYHHVTVLLYCWHSYAVEAPQALYFVTMNYSVHSVMYGYYALSAMKVKPVWLPPVMITVMQISQMLIGVLIQIKASYEYFNSSYESCPLNGNNIFWGGIMYASYFKLFFDFAKKRYIKPQRIKLLKKV